MGRMASSSHDVGILKRDDENAYLLDSDNKSVILPDVVCQSVLGLRLQLSRTIITSIAISRASARRDEQH